MRIRWLLAFALLIALLTACQKQPWKEFSSTEGRFSVLMPGTPSERTLKADTEGGVVDMYSFALVVKERGYDVSYYDYPAATVETSDVDRLLDERCDAAVSGVQGNLLDEFIISLEEYPGRDIRIAVEDGEHTIRTRLYLVDNRLYQVVVVTPKEDSFSNDIPKFLDSFTLLDQ